MLEEKQLVPYDVSPLPAGPWLVFAPHPDDETFGMGGSLLLAARQGIDIVLVVLTDGALGGNEDAEALAATREAETREAARRLGIKETQFWRQKDRKLQTTDPLIEKISDLVRRLSPASVFFPSPMELHPDHRTTAILVWEGLRRGAFSGTACAYEISVQGQINRLIDITSVVDEKRAIMGVYESQLAQNDYSGVVLALNKARTYTLPQTITGAEGFYAYASPINTDLAYQTLSSLRAYWQPATADRFPLVSVIIRTKDCPQLLKKALDSVMEQTYGNLEIVVVNDGGIPVSELLETYQNLSPQIRYINLSANQGRTAAANIGLDNARGQYLIFLDDNDLFEADHIANLVEVLHAQPACRVAYTGYRTIDDSGADAAPNDADVNLPYSPQRLMCGNHIPVHAAMFQRALIESGCRFDERIEFYEDWDFWLQLAQHTRFCHVDKTSALYRSSGASGVGVNMDAAKVQDSRSKIFEKWKALWSGTQIYELLDYLLQAKAEGERAATLLEIKEKQRQAAEELIKEREEEANTAQKLFRKKEAQLASTSSQLAEVRASNQKLAHHAAALERQLELILRSHSWNLTKPLRWLRRKFAKSTQLSSNRQ